MSHSNHQPAPAYSKAIECFASLVRMGMSIAHSRAIARQYAPTNHTITTNTDHNHNLSAVFTSRFSLREFVG